MGIFELLILLNEGGQAFFIPNTAGESLELCVRLLASGGNPTDPNLVADDLQTLPALDDSPGIRCQSRLMAAVSWLTYIGNSPSTRQMYSFLTCLVLI